MAQMEKLGFRYIPNFITAEEETTILTKIPPNRWTSLTHRRLQAHPTSLSAKGVLLAAPLPDWLATPMLRRFEQLGTFAGTPHGRPNHVLVNEYRPGQGIMAHEDGPAYAPVVATVSLGAAVVLDVYEKSERGERVETASIPKFRILQEPRSLLITTDQAYTSFTHGIAPVSTDGDLGPSTVANWSLLGAPDLYESGTSARGVRISLTYRDVLKLSSLGSSVLGLARR